MLKESNKCDHNRTITTHTYWHMGAIVGSHCLHASPLNVDLYACYVQWQLWVNVLISNIFKLSRIHKQLRDATQGCASTVRPVFVVVVCVCVWWVCVCVVSVSVCVCVWCVCVCVVSVSVCVCVIVVIVFVFILRLLFFKLFLNCFLLLFFV